MHLDRQHRGSIITCEHASKRIPPNLRTAFQGAQRAINSHRGIDFGAHVLSKDFARDLEAPLIAGEVSRLVVDLNRSLHHRGLFSEWSRELDDRARAGIVERYWQPYRDRVDQAAQEQSRAVCPLLHLSVHSFTPQHHGTSRKVDVALLYAPSREREKAFVTAWLDLIRMEDPSLRLRRNHPYRGDSDGLTSSMRRRRLAHEYLGIEVEISQSFPLGPRARWDRLRRMLGRTLIEVTNRAGAKTTARGDPGPFRTGLESHGESLPSSR